MSKMDKLIDALREGTGDKGDGNKEHAIALAEAISNLVVKDGQNINTSMTALVYALCVHWQALEKTAKDAGIDLSSLKAKTPLRDVSEDKSAQMLTAYVIDSLISVRKWGGVEKKEEQKKEDTGTLH